MVYLCNGILFSRENKQSIAIHINMDEYQIIMLSEKNKSHKNTVIIPFTKNKDKSHIHFRDIYVC